MEIAEDMQDAAADQELLDLMAEASAAEGIRQGLEDVKNGRTRAAQEALDEIRAAYAIPRRADGARSGPCEATIEPSMREPRISDAAASSLCHRSDR